MPARYDSTTGVAELGAKYRITEAVLRGWDIVGAGDVPKPVPSVPEVVLQGEEPCTPAALPMEGVPQGTRGIDESSVQLPVSTAEPQSSSSSEE